MLTIDEIEGILRGVYGNDTPLWMRRWRWFFLATAGLFGYAEGSEWGVSHYRMKARSRRRTLHASSNAGIELRFTIE